MANSLNSRPLIIDTDITTWRNNAAIVAAGYATGIRVVKLILQVGTTGTSVAGTVTITAPSDSATLYTPLTVPVGQTANVVLFTDEPTEPLGTLTWRDFAVTGVTATNTRLLLWWTV